MKELDPNVLENAFVEVGSTGTTSYGGLVSDEFLHRLEGESGRRIYKEMRYNDSVISAVLFAINMLISQVQWSVDPGTDDEEGIRLASFVESCMYDMKDSWVDFIGEVLDMLPYGFSLFEQCYKHRDGSESAYNDGLIGWKSLATRPQDTVKRWLFDASGNIEAVEQTTNMGVATIPIDKLLVFNTNKRRGNPEGMSVLRNCYRAWFFKKKFEEIEGIGIERDLAGLPVAEVPPDYLASDAPIEKKAVATAIKKILQNVKQNHQASILWPLAYNDAGQEMFRLKLLTSGGKRNFDIGAIISRYDTRIAGTMLADFILLGQTGVGSFALASSKTHLFGVAIGAFLDRITQVLNAKAIPTLIRLNGFDTSKQPYLVHGDIEVPDLGIIGDFVSKLSASGIDLTDNPTVNRLRDFAGLPNVNQDDSE